MKVVIKETNITLADNLKIARSFWDRAIGLIGATQFASKDFPYDGLKIENCRSVHSLFMKMKIALVFLDRNNRIVAYINSFSPWRVSRFYLKAASVLELPPEKLEKIRIRIGDQISFQSSSRGS